MILGKKVWGNSILTKRLWPQQSIGRHPNCLGAGLMEEVFYCVSMVTPFPSTVEKISCTIDTILRGNLDQMQDLSLQPKLQDIAGNNLGLEA